MTKIDKAHLGLGLDLLGSQTTIRSNKRTGSVVKIWWEQDPEGHYHAVGLLAVSGKNGRQVGIPFANLKGVELDVPHTEKPNPLSLGSRPKNTPLTAGNAGQSQVPSTIKEQQEEMVDPIIEQAKRKKAAVKDNDAKV